MSNRIEQSGARESTSPMRVVILHRGHGDAQRYRCAHLKEQLALAGLSGTVQEFQEGEARSVPECDLLILHRIPLDRFLRGQFEGLRRRGTLVLFDTDDLVFDVGEAIGFAVSIGEGWLKRAFYREDLKGFIRTLGYADGALVSTEYLAERVKAVGKPVWMHRNAFSQKMLGMSEQAFRERRPEPNKVIIGYASGTPTHERDFAQVTPVLREILGRNATVELRLVGHIESSGEWGRLSERVVRVPFVPWQQLPRVLAKFDLNLAPLEVGQPFCEAKSEIKYVEAGLVRVPTLASATLAFTHAIRDGVTGFLARDGDEWRTKLEFLIANAELRKAVGLAAYDDVVARYHPRVRARELVQMLGEVFLSLRGRTVDIRRAARAALEEETTGRFDEADVNESVVAPKQRASHLSRAWYSLRCDSPWLFLVRLMGFAALRLSLRTRDNDQQHLQKRRVP